MFVVLIGLLWGLNWPAVKFMLTEMPPFTIRAIAFLFAAIILAFIAYVRGQNLLPATRDVLPIVITGLLIIFGFNILTAFGQMVTETSKAAIIAYTMPALTAVFASVVLGENLEAQHKVALVLGMAGIGVLASENFGALLSDPTGPVIMFFAAFTWALGNVALKSRTWSLSALPLTVWFLAVSSIVCWPLVLLFEPPWEQSVPSASVLLTLLYHTVGPMVVCYTLWTILVDRLPATVAAIATLLAPIVGVSSAVILLGDQLTWQKIAALSLILVSISMTLAKRTETDS
ncbi:MAG: DMT family transporter [Sneathiella sp.]|uniref:DMT family transporter n=1 Tax=Sneathiella sp. TaxID=1964365 RepID=UPI0030034402